MSKFLTLIHSRNSYQPWKTAEYDHLQLLVENNKQEIEETKNRLDGLEEQIVEISEKMK